VATVLVRAAFVGPLVYGVHKRALRAERIQPRLAAFQERVEAAASTEALQHVPKRTRRRFKLWDQRASRDEMRQHLTRLDADITHMLAQPLGWREGTVIVWAGMRGVVTIAAAQTLPTSTPHRALLVLIAFFVAVGSLLIQGGLMGFVQRLVKPARGPSAEEISEERARLEGLLHEATLELRAELESGGEEPAAAELTLVKARRDALLDIRDLGTYSAAALEEEMRRLDADQLRLDL
jgi:CPA1 family monovalent cation:H+ antiporter